MIYIMCCLPFYITWKCVSAKILRRILLRNFLQVRDQSACPTRECSPSRTRLMVLIVPWLWRAVQPREAHQLTILKHSRTCRVLASSKRVNWKVKICSLSQYLRSIIGKIQPRAILAPMSNYYSTMTGRRQTRTCTRLWILQRLS